MRASVFAVLALTACGDNTTFHFGLDAGYADRDHSRFFGEVAGVGPMGGGGPLVGASVCVGGECTSTAMGGTFVVTGSGPLKEATMIVSQSPYMATVVPVIGGVPGDHNVEQVPVLSIGVVNNRATAFGVDPMIGPRGTVVVNTMLYDRGKLQVAMDGMTTYYLDAKRSPDPARTEMSESGVALFFAVPPGEVTLHTTTGHCLPAASGWAGEGGDVRIPVTAGNVSFVRLICVGGS